MLEVAKDFRPHEVVYLGDFFDCYSISEYTKDPEEDFRLLEDELIIGRRMLRQVESVTKAKEFTFVQGNHEDRIDRYVNNHAAKLARSISSRKVLGIPDSYRWFPYGLRNHYRMDRLIATHGSLCGVHPASAMVRRYGCSVIFGHTHLVQEHTIKNVSGQEFTAYNVGWLGDMAKAAEYIKNVANWSHAFALGYFTLRGDFWIDVVRIKDYRCVSNGHLFTGRKK